MGKIDKISIDSTEYEIVPEIAPLFNPNNSYSTGDCVIHNAVLYKFTASHTGVWTGNDVTAFEVGSELVRLGSGGSGSGITEAVKAALLACFEKVAWIDEDGQDYYDALYDALYPPADLVSISAVFTQGSAVIYDTDSLDTLKQYLVVTAHMSDSSTQTVTNYALSGTLSAGTSTITVSYGGKTTTFNVTVTYYESPVMSATQGNITSGSTDSDKVTVVLNKVTFAPSEVKTISVDDGYQFFAFRQYGVNDASNAGTAYASNQMNVYSIGNNGYVQKGNEANDRISINNTATWTTSKTYTNSNSSITQEVTGLGIYIKTTDGSALTPEQAVNVFSIS